MAKASKASDEPIIVKKYANRRLYDTQTSTYVTLEDLALMVREERDFIVIDAKTKEDITHSVLTQIILERETRGENLLPANFLRQLIRFYGHSMQKFVPSYLELSLGELAKQQEKYRDQISTAFAGTPVSMMQEQTKKNLEMFEQAMAMFSPFPSNKASAKEDKGDANACSKAETPKAKSTPRKTARRKAPAQVEKNDEQLAELKTQLDELQKQIAKMSD